MSEHEISDLNKYQDWMNNYKKDIYRKCVEVTEEMQSVFPELIIVSGLVQTIEKMDWYPHQWLITKDGRIIDPTANQWAHICEYNEIKKEDPQIIGKCLNCGRYIFENGFSLHICSPECDKEFKSDLMGSYNYERS